MQPPDTQYVRRPDGVSIAYQVVGSGSIDVLFAPAFVSHLDFLWTDPSFVRFIERLCRFARVILYDKPGTGLSDPLSYVPTLEERAGDITSVLDAAGSDRTALIGFSASGPTCVLLAASEPERLAALVLICTTLRFPEPDAPDLPEGVTPGQVAQIWTDFEELPEHWGEGLLVRLIAPTVDTALQRRFWGRFERACATPSMVKGLIEFGRGLDVREIARTVDLPVLVIHTSEDRFPVQLGREAAEVLPNARFVEFPGHDHAFWFAENDAIVDEIEEFLTGTREAPRSNRVLATVLFTDMVDSTAQAAERGDQEWRNLIERHNALVENRVVRGGGRVVKFIGDGTMCSFPGPVAAVQCADELCREARLGLGLALRAGVHTGECELIGDDLVGLAVHIGARVSAQAGPDEVLVSDAVRDLAHGSGLEFDPRGTHDLKGVPGRWTLHALRGVDGAGRVSIQHGTVRPSIGDRATVALARRAPRLMRAMARATRGHAEPA